MASKVGVGIDLSRAKPDVAVHGVGQCGTFSREEEGLEERVEALECFDVHHVAFKAIGGYEQLALFELAAVAVDDTPLWQPKLQQLRGLLNGPARSSSSSALRVNIITSTRGAVERQRTLQFPTGSGGLDLTSLVGSRPV